MNEPPPPYSVYDYDGLYCIVVWDRGNDTIKKHISSSCDYSAALKRRDDLNAAYMQGWRDRDEREGEDE